MQVRKVKRPGGDFTFTVQPLVEDEHGQWVYGPIGSPWTAPHDSGTLPVDVIALFDPDHWFVTWWVDRPGDRRVEIDISLPPERTTAGWTYVDLELDPIRHEDGTVEVEDHDEYEDACRNGWISPEHAAIALETAQRMADRLRAREEPWGDEGWRRLTRARARLHTFTTSEADPEVLARVRELLDDAFDDYADTDWQNALGGRHVVVTEHDTVVAHASVVPRRIDVGERTVRTGYVESVATAPGPRRPRSRLARDDGDRRDRPPRVRDGRVVDGSKRLLRAARLGALAGPDVRPRRPSTVAAPRTTTTASWSSASVPPSTSTSPHRSPATPAPATTGNPTTV